MIYWGCCHCGSIRWWLDCPKITQAVRCNCSICQRRGVAMSEDYYGPDCMQIKVDKNRQTYRFGDHLVDHFFCGQCGVYVFHQATEKPGFWRINLACLEGLDRESLDIRWVDGRSF